MYTEALSCISCQLVLDSYIKISNKLLLASGTSRFPLRKCWRDIPVALLDKLSIEVLAMLSLDRLNICGEYGGDIIIKGNFRLYESSYGIVKPHHDVPMCGDDTHTCLIYLTDNFTGGVLSVEVGEKIETLTFIPKIGYAVVFPKYAIHYTDEQFDGTKIVLLVDLRITSFLDTIVVLPIIAVV